MNDNTKKSLIAVLPAAALMSVGAIFVVGSEAAICELHPELDPKLVKKAHRRMLLKSMRGKYTDAQMSSDRAMDNLLIQEVNALLPIK